MSFGQAPFPPYVHNPQFLFAAANAAAAASASAASTSTENTSGYNSLISKSSSDLSSSSSSVPDSIITTATTVGGRHSLAFPAPTPANAASNASVNTTAGNLLPSSSESVTAAAGGEMSSDSLRVLASSLLVPSAQSQTIVQSGPQQGHPPPHLGPLFAGMPTMDPYRLPPPPFSLYSGGISPAGGPLDLKMPDGLPPPPFAHSAAGAITPFYYDPAFASGYPFAADRFGNPLDLNGARRKNATRETTAALKAWLYEHRKNPYPTKGEKIMLAIITKMTLTQVSTWFANARRRLKKENKMTWSPRNRPGEDDDPADGNSNTQENTNAQRPGSSLSSLGDDIQDGDDDEDDLGHDNGCNLIDEGAKSSLHGSDKPESDEKAEPSGSSVKRPFEEVSSESPKKPKIWSIAETVASPDVSPHKSKPSSLGSPHQPHQQQQQGPYHFTFPPWPHMAAAAAFAGRTPMMPPNSMSGPSSFPFGGMPPGPFMPPPSSLPPPHQLRPEMFARNFFAPMPAPMMNTTGLPGFLNGFSFGCGAPNFPFGFGFPHANNQPPTITSHHQSQSAEGAGTAVTVNDQQHQQAEGKNHTNNTTCGSTTSPVSTDGKSSNSSQEPKTNN